MIKAAFGRLPSPTLNPFFAFFCFLFPFTPLSSQSGSWQLWASGLQSGVYPKLAIAPNHDIFYCMTGTGGTPGIIYQSNTLNSMGSFTALPAVPLPVSHINNIQCIETNANSELLAGIFRSNILDPWLFRFNTTTQQWVTATTTTSPTLGADAIKRAPNGDIWVGGKWSKVYHSTDNGNTYAGIDESVSVAANAPCYYPSWSGANADNAIYGINVDNNGRVYAGSESAGVVYSDNNGVTWQPADFFACKVSDPLQKDTASPMRPLSYSGNVAGLGFTAANNLIWSGANMWAFNGWVNELGFADMTNHTTSPVAGIPTYLITQGQQISKIVTTPDGQIFLHSGGAAGASGIGIYYSTDGINWTLFNTGITGLNDNQTQGSLAVDGNNVFMATHDGKIFKYTAAPLPVELSSLEAYTAGKVITLDWQTENERNCDHFEVERSADGAAFERLGNISSHHSSSSRQNYRFTDSDPMTGINYYRLKTVDMDQRFSYSTIVSADYLSISSVRIFS